MKKTIVIIISALIAVADASAQNVFFGTKEGMTLTYANLNNKGRADSYSRQIIKKVEGSGSNMTITYEGEALDKNKKPASNHPVTVSYTLYIRNGVMEWDMKSFAAPGTEGVIEIEGDKLRIPQSLAPGVKLDDVNFTMTVNMGFKITTTIALTEQECIAIEDVTVPASTFKCHKVTQTSAVTAMRRTMTTKTTTWYMPGIGSVKTETFNEKGQLQSSMVLESVGS